VEHIERRLLANEYDLCYILSARFIDATIAAAWMVRCNKSCWKCSAFVCSLLNPIPVSPAIARMLWDFHSDALTRREAGLTLAPQEAQYANKT
jgi:hypothetical protein